MASARDEALSGRLRDWVPRWWRGEGGPVGRVADLVLWPVEGLFRLGVRARNLGYERGLLRVERGPIPTISVGNLGVGGTGKTPFAAWIAGRLSGWGASPAIVLRGYGADEIEVHRELNPSIPVFAAARRIEAVREAASAGRDVAVLDDAFQHRALARDLDVVLVSADGWDGRLRLLPRGPWREALPALSRADLVVVTRKVVEAGIAGELETVVAERVGAERVVRCLLEASGARAVRRGGGGETADLRALAGRRVVAVTSLADPRPFSAALERVASEVELRAFPDHHDFTAAEVAALESGAGDRPLVMTRKEAVKLRGLLSGRTEAWMVEQRVVIESGGNALDSALRRAMTR